VWCSSVDEMSMLQSVKKLLWVALLAFGLQGAWGFALLGPLANGGDAWQTPVIGYGLAYEQFIGWGGPVNLGDIGGPKNIGEGYRRNVPVIYYSYDANFLDFFGSNGMVAVDSAFSIMNNAFTNNPTGVTNGVDGYSTSLQEFPDTTESINYEAQALELTDLKSVTLHTLVEQLGLAEPERFTWTLAERVLPTGGKCPIDEEYLVVQRNFNIANSALNQIQYSPYVNDTLYTYEIEEACTGPNPLAITVPFSVDPLSDVYTAVAANNADGLSIGGFYTGLTRDDVGGLRYLLTSNNIAYETSAAGSLFMNPGTTELLTSSNLNDLLPFASTNDPAVLPNFYPGLTVTGFTNYWTVTCTPNVNVVFKSENGAPVGSPQISVLVTNGLNCVPQEIFVDTFANVITNGNLTNNPGIVLNNANTHFSYYTNTSAILQTVMLGTKSGQPYPAPISTNVTSKNITLTNTISGEYLILPPGQCGWQIVSVLLTNVLRETNIIASATNTAGFVATESIVTLFTNHTFVVRPIVCAGTGTGLYEGIEKVQFVRADFDSLLGQFFQPITTDYNMVGITNSRIVVQGFQRVVTAPDILLTAADDIAANTFDGTVTRNINFDEGNVLPGLAGPGVINSPTTISYNKVGDAFENSYDFTAALNTNVFLTEASQLQDLQWASFDDSTNDPVVYPNGTSIANLQNQVLVQISPASLPDAAAGAFYTQTLTATGGAFSQPFTWSASGLPSGLSMTSNSDSTGTLSGTPTQSGTFDIVIQLTDSLGRSVTWNYTINVY
jgi:hypothetical protein